MTLPRVKLYSLGGTITMEQTSGGGVMPALDADALCRAVPGLDRIADIDARTMARLASGNLTYAHGFDLAKDIMADEAADGFVIVQGTDTLEEMAFLLDCLLELEKPVVVTGALRPPAALSADGPANIMAAVTCAASKEIALAGVVVVMNEDILAAGDVSKSHTAGLAAFTCPNMGPIGRITEGRARLFSIPVAGPKFTIPRGRKLPKIALLKASFDDGAYLLSLLEDSDFQGLVIEGFGAGHLPESYLASLDRLAAKIPVILCSRTGAGPGFQKTYGYRGAEIDLIGRGLIPSGLLDGLKAKILLTLLLMNGHDLKSYRPGGFW